MDHLLFTAGRRCLIVQPQESSYGKTVGFGNLIRNMEETLEVGRQFDALVFLVKPRNAMNQALFELECEGVQVVRRHGAARWPLTFFWRLSAPFRRRAPRAWAMKTVARAARAAGHGLLARTREVGKPARLKIKRHVAPVLAWAERATVAYATRIAVDWRGLVRESRKRRRQALRTAHQGPLVLRLRPERERQASAVARRLGIAPDARLVTLHVRESGYRPSLAFRQRRFDDGRNARVETYVEAIDYLVAHGFTVVRVGDRTMTPLVREGLVDLATSPLRDDFVEFWCLARSAFFIGCDSGPIFWSQLLRMPRLAVNLVQFGVGEAKATDRYLPKQPVDRRTGRPLSLSEMLREEYLRYGRDSERYAHLDNSAEELRLAVEDMVEVIAGHDHRSPAQQRYEARLSEIVEREWTPEWEGPWSITIRRERLGTISRAFADRRFTVDSRAGTLGWRGVPTIS